MHKINQIELPDFLFYENKNAETLESPTDHFDPVEAVSNPNNAWKAATSPLEEFSLNTIIFNKKSFPEFSLKDSISLITKLKSLGFDVRLCCKEGDEMQLVKVDEVKNLPSQLFSLAEIKDEGEVLLLAAKHDLPHDKVAAITVARHNEIMQSLNSGAQWSARLGVSASHLNADARSVGVIAKEPKNLPFLLKYSKTKDEALGYIEQYGEEFFSGGGKLNQWLTAVPEMTIELLELYQSRITTLDDLIACVRLVPERADELIKNHATRLITDENLLIFLDNVAQFSEKTINALREKIKSDRFFNESTTSNSFSGMIGFLSGINPHMVKEWLEWNNERYKYNLAYALKAFPEKAEELIAKHKDKITTKEDLISCIKAVPHALQTTLIKTKLRQCVRNGNDLVRIMGEFPDRIKELMDEFRVGKVDEGFFKGDENAYQPDSFSEFIDILAKSAPQLARDWLAWNNKQNPAYSYNLVTQLKLNPELAEEIIANYGIFSLENNLPFMQNLPENITRLLIIKYAKDIPNILQVSFCITGAPDFAEEFARNCQREFYETAGKINWSEAYHLKEARNFAAEIVQQHETEIENGLHLGYALEMAPTQAEELINKHSSKIESGVELAICLKVVSDQFKKLLLEKNDSKITNSHDLARCLEAVPDYLKELLLEKYAHKIRYENDLRSCLEAAPNCAEKLINEHGHKIKTPGVLADCLKAAPDFAEKIIAKVPHLFSQILTDYESDTPQDVLKRHPLMVQDRLGQDQFCAILHYFYIHRQDTSFRYEQYTQAFRYLVDDQLLSRNRYFADLDWLREGDYQSQKPHFFSVSNLDDFKELLISQKDLLSEVSVLLVRDVEGRVDEFLELVKKLPNLCHIMVPEKSFAEFESKNHGQYSCEAVQVVGFDPQILERVQSPKAPSSFGTSVSSNTANGARDFAQNASSAASAAEKENEIFIGEDGNIVQSVSTTNDDATFQMVKAGEVLNGSSEDLQVRVAVIEFPDINTSLQFKKFTPQVFEEVSFETLNKTAIDKFRSLDPKISGTHYLFNCPMQAGNSYRLLSVSAQEDFVGLMSDNANAQITIQKGEDGFYYATSDRDCLMSYVTKSVSHNNFRTIPPVHPIRQILDEYFDVEKGYKPTFVGEVPQYDAARHQEWLEEIFKTRAGNCEQRVAALKFKMGKIPGIDKKDVRAIRINNNHVILEVRYNNKWYPVDLGGSPRSLNFSQSEVYNPQKMLEEELSKATVKKSATNRLQLAQHRNVGLQSEVVAIPLHISQADELMREVIEPKSIVRKEDELAPLIAGRESILLNTHGEIDKHANLILSKQDAKRLVYYIDSPAKIDLQKKRIFIDKDGIPKIAPDGALSEFLAQANSTSDPAPLLLINWDAFDAKQRLALNSVLDRDRSIAGKKLPNSVQVVSLCAELPKDISFLSRHKKIVHSEIKFREQTADTFSKAIEIDLQGFPDWRSYLLGEIVLNGKNLEWKKSEFVQHLLKGKKFFEFKNIAPENEQKLRYELDQAKALGYLNYHGFKIPLGKDFNFTFNYRSFDFAKFTPASLKLFVRNEVTSEDVSAEIPVINSMLFDKLLVDKSISGGLYKSCAGLIENAKLSSDKRLKFFLTSDLSQSQWYCLLEQASKNGVTLEILAAKGIRIPTEIKPQILPKEKKDEAKLGFSGVFAKVYVTNDAAKTTKQIASEKESPIIIDVEDFSYSDLVHSTKFATTESGFRDFKKIESAVIQKLKAGRKVILKGEFNPAFLQTLHPILLGQGEFSKIAQNLTLVIDDAKISESATVYEPLKFLPQDRCIIEHHQPIKIAPVEVQEDILSCVGLEDSKAKAQKFIERRREVLARVLAQRSLLKLSGNSGVGKSSLIADLEENKANNNFVVFREFADFEKWKNDKTPGKKKLLFLDEANISNLHLTIFSPLKIGGTRQILYKGELHEIGPDHCVVFACNDDKSYGGGRVEQKLFEDGSIAEFHLQDFPDSYIYEKILKEKIYDALDAKVKAKIPETEFKNKCQSLIENYQKHNAAESDPRKVLTVRELQEQVMQYIDEIYSGTHLVKSHDLQNDHFISTSATAEVETDFRIFLNIRERQRAGLYPQSSVGTNGILLQGDSGIGKSEMVRAMFADFGIREARADELKNPTTDKIFYRIDAAMSLEEKTRIVCKALDEKNYVWIDELNSCIDDGFEKVLNAALNGLNVLTGKYAKMGLPFVATANNINLEGRAPLSPALVHRMICKQLKPLKEYQDDDIEKIARNIGLPAHSKKLCEVFKYLRDEYPSYFNLRVFDNIAKLMGLKKTVETPEFKNDWWRQNLNEVKVFLEKNPKEKKLFQTCRKELLKAFKPADLKKNKGGSLEADIAFVRENTALIDTKFLITVNQNLNKTDLSEQEKITQIFYLLCFGTTAEAEARYRKLAGDMKIAGTKIVAVSSFSAGVYQAATVH